MKKRTYAICILLGMAMLTACNLPDVPTAETITPIVPEESVSTTPSPNLSEAEESILTYETKYYAGEFTQEDYYSLATLYEEQGLIRKQRDLLEQCYRLYGDEASYFALQDITVNIAEEDGALEKEVQLLLQNLSTADYFAEGIHQIESPQWMELFMPKLKEGTRRYYLEEDGRIKLVLHAGYNADGKTYSTVWYHGEEDSLALLNYNNGIVQVLNTSMINNVYEGPFTLTLLDGVTGSIAVEQGTFTGGVYSNEYSLKLFKGKASGDPYDLWNNRENVKYSTYKATADEQGAGELEQFASKLETYPSFNTYEPTILTESSPDNISADAPQIRIYDGEIQWWNGQGWQSMGSASQYQKEDPFYNYEQQWATKDSDNTDEGLDLDNIDIPKPKPSKPTSSPTQQPSVQAPSPNPTPAPAPTPEPEPDDDDDDDDDDHGDSSPEPEPEPEPDDSGSSDDGSNDADVEWTPDIM